MHFYAWKRGVKTGIYYLRTRPKADAIQFTVDQEALQRSRALDKKAGAESKEEDEEAKKDSPVKGAPVEEDDAPACVYVRRGQAPPEDCLMCGS